MQMLFGYVKLFYVLFACDDIGECLLLIMFMLSKKYAVECSKKTIRSSRNHIRRFQLAERRNFHDLKGDTSVFINGALRSLYCLRPIMSEIKTFMSLVLCHLNAI